MEKRPLTDKQQIIYTFIRDYVLTHKRSPSLRTIAYGTHRTLTPVAQLVQQLQAKGWITKGEVGRFIELTEPDPIHQLIQELFAAQMEWSPEALIVKERLEKLCA